ncbi:MAG TPA: C-terminal binding protein [Baekduia sp.]|nr:C-terminal binding protein [Baekduia sp.]
MSRSEASPVFVLADGPFVDADLVGPLFAAAGVTLRRAVLDSPSAVAAATADADGVVLVTNPLPAELVAALAPTVKVVGRAGVGLDAIDLAAVAAHGVSVFHTPDYCVDEVATHAVAMALALNRRLLAADAVVRRDWTSWRELTPVAPLHEQTVGIVGLGLIGRAVARRFATLAGEVVGFDPMPASEVEDVHRAATVDELLERSDIVSLHIPLTAETERIVDAAALERMKPGALLVNVSRGGLVDEAALIAALSSGQLAGAALDVFASEPLGLDDPLLTAPNLLLSPHFAWYSSGSERGVWAQTIDGMLAVLRGEAPPSGRIAAQPTAPSLSAE